MIDDEGTLMNGEKSDETKLDEECRMERNDAGASYLKYHSMF